MAAHSNQWGTGPAAQTAAMPQQQQQQQQGDGYGPQMRSMGLKVQYTFDKDSQVNCLARWPHNLQIQTISLDDRNSIGVIDLRTCLQAVANCSPEIVNQQEHDYTVYASDYSEPDVPLVGQGMLSWGLDPNSDPQSQQLVTGRVTRNLMALFGNRNTDTLEVRLKLTAVPKIHRVEAPRSNVEPQPQQHQQQQYQHQQHQQQQHQQQPPPPPLQQQQQQQQQHHNTSFNGLPDTTNAEWNSLLQSNPGFGQPSNHSRFPSPSVAPARVENPMPESRYTEPQPDNTSFQHPENASSQQNQPPSSTQAPPPGPIEESLPQLPQFAQQTAQLAPPPTSDAIVPEKPPRPSRPSSRASRKAPTGRPRGRPRKKPVEAGHTSGAEMTDADDGPQRKRAKVVTQVDYNTTAPFSSHPDSLRVAASTSGSLRNMRPVGAAGAMPAGTHLQDVPRAPTPVPSASKQQKLPPVAIPRKGSLASFDMYQAQVQTNNQTSMGNSQDARSPTESVAQSPDQGYTPDESPADLGSSPPVPRMSAYIPSSPAPSSPTLPPVDSGFMSGGIDDFFDEDDLMQELPTQDGQPDMLPKLPRQKPAPQTADSQENFSQEAFCQPQNFHFHEVNPGPPELLPVNSIFRPAGRAKALNRLQSAPFEPKGPPAPRPLAPTPRQLRRSNTAPMAPRAAPQPAAQRLPATKASFEIPVESVERADSIPSAPRVKESAMQPSQPRVLLEISKDGTASTRTVREPSQQESTCETPKASPQEQERRDIDPPVAEPERPTTKTGAVTTLLAAPAVAEPIPAPSSLPASQMPQAPVLLPPMRQASPRTKSLPPPPVPASDSAVQTFLTLPQLPEMPPSEGPSPAGEGEEQPKYNKNLHKRQSIKDRLESAIARGEMPPFCNNCGAIETPTWRKIWTQDHQGVPGFHELSDKPGFVTCIDILERNPEGKPTLYRLVKKNLGVSDQRMDWKELLLCNPCGIWLAKFKGHRPADRWDKDAARLGQPRKKRGQNGGNSRSKRSRTKSDAQMNPTSDAFPMTDPVGPGDQESPKEEQEEDAQSRYRRQSTQITEGGREQSQPVQPTLSGKLEGFGHLGKRAPGSTHSRGSGTADSPIALEDNLDSREDLGATRRLLFPSPRKDGVPKVLGELAVNLVQTAPDFQQPKPATSDKENVDLMPGRAATPLPHQDDDNLDQELFGTPPPRPSTPPPKSANSGPFKTPTRPTPSHRPITRSISRSIRSAKSGAKSPSQVLLQFQRTPSKTPRSAGAAAGAVHFSLGLGFSAGKQRTTPRGARFDMEGYRAAAAAAAFGESPFTATMNQLLSEANDFTSGSPSHGLGVMDHHHLAHLHSDDDEMVMRHLAASAGAAADDDGLVVDFGSFLPADLGVSSSSPVGRQQHQQQHHDGDDFSGMDESAVAELWARLSAGEEVGEKAG